MNVVDAREVEVLAEKLPEFHLLLEKMNKKALKLGVEPMSVVEVGRSTCKIERDDRVVNVPMVHLLLSGMTPRLPGGWEFLGSIEYAVNGVTLVHGDDPRLLPMREMQPFCEHCKTKRLRRKMIVLQSAAGEIVRVGSTCLKDFLGYHESPERLLSYFADLFREVDGFGDARGSEMTFDLLQFVTAVAATMRYYGAYRATSVSDSTAKVTKFVLDPYIGGSNEERKVGRTIRESICVADREKAAAAIEWAKNLHDESSYLMNLSEICSTGVLLTRHYGFAASLVQAYERDVVKTARDAQRDAEVAGVVVEGRYVIEGTVLSTKWVENAYGESLKMLVRVEQSDGVVRLWGSVPAAIDPEIGDVVRFTAAVETGRDADFGFFKRPTKAEVVSDDVDVDVDATEEIFGFVKGVLDASTPDLDDDVVREPVVVELRTRRGHFPRCTLRLPVGHGLAAHDRVRMVVRSAARENATAADVLTIEKA